MARTTRAEVKSRKRRKEAADDRREALSDDSRRPPDETGGTERGESPPPVQSGLSVKRPGMSDLSLDELANCPSPEDALLLLSTATAEAVRSVPEAARLEICKTIVALGDVVARTHQPLMAAIKLTVGESGGIQTTAEANGRIFHRWAGVGLMPGFVGAICAVARMESKTRSGTAHAVALDGWARALIDAGTYLQEISTTARTIAKEMIDKPLPPEQPYPLLTNQPEPPGFDTGGPVFRRPVHGDANPKRGRGGVKMCQLHRNCVHEPEHHGPCCNDIDADHDGLCSTDDDTGECGRSPTAVRPAGCVRQKDHTGGCSSVRVGTSDLVETVLENKAKSLDHSAEPVACKVISDCILVAGHDGDCTDGETELGHDDNCTNDD